MTQYLDGSIDIYHNFIGIGGGSAYMRFFLREKGTGWDENFDPLPPSSAAYKEIYATGN